MKIKKVILIEPKFENASCFSFFHMPKIGLLNLGSVLKHNGYEVKIYLEYINELDFNDISNADIVGISAFTLNVNRAYKIADKLRQMGIKVILGGPHATFMPEEALMHCDYVLRGEADKSFLDFIKCLEKNGPLDNVSGLSYKINNKVMHTLASKLMVDLDINPPLDLSLIPGYYEHKKKFIDFNSIRLDPISTSRGCPFNCKFCSVVKLFGRKGRMKSIDSVMVDIKRAINYAKKKTLFFVDDNFTINKERTKELLRRIIKEKLKIKYTAQVRADIVNDKELLALLKKSGCDLLCIGFESVNNKTLEAYNKKQDLAGIKLAIGRIHEQGINILGMFVVGADSDDIDIVKKTVEFALDADIEYILLSALTPLPGTELAVELEESKRILVKEWDKYDCQHVVIIPKNMKPSDLQMEIIKGYKEFYSINHIPGFLLKGKLILSFYRLLIYFLMKKATNDLKIYSGFLKRIEVSH